MSQRCDLPWSRGSLRPVLEATNARRHFRTRRTGGAPGSRRRGARLNSWCQTAGSEVRRCSVRQPEESHQSALNLNELSSGEAADPFLNVGAADDGELVDHDIAGRRMPVIAEGCSEMLSKGASTAVVVIGRTVTDSVASKRSSWMMSAGRGFVAYTPPATVWISRGIPGPASDADSRCPCRELLYVHATSDAAPPALAA